MKTPLFQLQYELDDSSPYTERGSNAGAKIFLDDVDDTKVRLYLQKISNM